MSGEERPPVKRWRGLGVSRSFRRMRSEEMTQSKTSPARGSGVPFESQRDEGNGSPQNQQISGGGKMEGEKESVLPSDREEQIGGE